MSSIIPTYVEAIVDKVVDGDTVNVKLNGLGEKLRLLSIDTEESHDDSDQERKQTQKGGKPITKLGNAAKQRARNLINIGDSVKLVFPDDKPLEEALKIHRGNYGRLLCFLELSDGRDFQEIMIREGWSPYLIKYGRAELPEKHFSYQNAEALAQAEGRGIWNSQLFNYQQLRHYEHLLPWWALRANIIENFRIYNDKVPESRILNSRKDYESIKELAKNNKQLEITIFTELRYVSLVSSKKAIIDNGSREQPFKLFLPNIHDPEGQKILSLLKNRYLTLGYDGSDVKKPGIDYVYVTGTLKMYKEQPEIVITKASQFSEAPRV